MKTPESINFKTGRSTIENYLLNNYPEFLQYINNVYSDSENTNEKVYRYFYNITEIPKCPICGNKNKFINYAKGYTKHCSYKCTQQDKFVRDKYKDTCKDKYGEDFYNKFYKKGAKTKLELYGDENYNNIEKTKSTMISRYGVDNIMKTEHAKQKSRNTCLERYNSEYYFSSNEYIKNKESHFQKTKNTCLEKYGAEYPMQNEYVKRKVNITCLEKYSVDWNCLRKEAHNSRNSNSTPNIEFANLLDKNNIKYEKEFYLEGYSYDFKVNDVLIDINPSATHNVNFNPFSKSCKIDKNYHKNKREVAIKNNYKVLFVFDWDDNDKILNILKEKEKIYARKCILKEISKDKAKNFLNENHLQNNCRGQEIRLGLFYNGELIQIITFGKSRYNKKYQYELLRLCTKKDKIVIGGSNKLFSYFIDNYNPESIISYCDISKFSGNVYQNLGFTKKQINQPSCHYINLKTKQHISSSLLNKLGFDKLFKAEHGKNTSNIELIKKHKFVQVYDCGQAVYIWKKTAK